MKKQTISIIFLVLAMLACNLPANGSDPNANSGTGANVDVTATFTAGPDVPSTEASSSVPSDCKPTATATTLANIRSGPALAYGVLGTLPLGGTVNVLGKSADSSWWYIDFPAGEGGHAWVAASVTSTQCIPATLAIIAAPPLPVAVEQPQNTGNSANDDNSDQQKPPPSAPNGIDITRQCKELTGGGYLFITYEQTTNFSWVDTSDNETGFNIFKDGTLIKTLGANSQMFTETFVISLPSSPTATYGVQAVNKHGGSDIKEASVKYCQ